MRTVGKLRFNDTAIVGLVVIAQGAGSAVAKAVWDSNWGLLAVAERWTPVPAWAGFALAAVGVLIVVLGLRSAAAGR